MRSNEDRNAVSCRLSSLAERWRVLGLMAVALARHVSLMTKMRANGAAEAGLLEALLYQAIVQISRDITACSARAATLSCAEKDALQYLKLVYTTLMMLALLMRQMRSDFESAAEAYARLAGALRIRDRAMPTPRKGRVAAIDSS